VTLVLVALAGAVGAPARYLVDVLVQRRSGRTFPWGTLVINVTGSFLLGFLVGLGLYNAFPARAYTVLGTGFCGAYTTFSTFAFETHRLLEEGASRDAVVNVVLNTALGAAAAAAGWALAAAA
jgi:CrcB protein